MPPRPVDDDGVEEIAIDSGDVPDSPGGGTMTFGVAGREVTVDNLMMPYLGQIAAAIVLLIAILAEGNSKNKGWGIAGSVIALVFAAAALYMVPKEALSEHPLGTFPYFGSCTYGSGLARFLFIWWFIIAGILTFSGPFLVTSNGYFACWGGVAFAAMGMGVTRDQMSQAIDLGHVNGLMAASIVLISAVIPQLGKEEPYQSESLYALILTILTVVAILLFGSSTIGETLKFPVFTVFSIMWVVMAALVTFRGPFQDTGNGYFASWIGAILCCAIAGQSRRGSLSNNV